MSERTRLILILVALNVLWAPVNAAVRLAIVAGFSPDGIGVTRWLGISACLFGLLAIPWVRRQISSVWPQPKDALLAALIGLGLTGPSHLLYYFTLQHVGTTEGTVFNSTAPLWTALFAFILLREPVGLQRWVALGLGALGAYITTAGFGMPSFHHGHEASSLLYMLGTLLECVAGVLIARLIRRSSGVTVFAFETLGMAAGMLLGPLVDPVALHRTIPALGLGWLPLVYLVIFAGVITFGGWTWLVEKTPLSFMVISIAVQPPVAAVIGSVYFGEKITTALLVGTMVIVAALVVGATERKIQLDEDLTLGGTVLSIEPTLEEMPAQ